MQVSIVHAGIHFNSIFSILAHFSGYGTGNIDFWDFGTSGNRLPDIWEIGLL